jgi:hypothetical protein
VYEHKISSKLPEDLIPYTFSATTFWNGMLAICAGVIANIFAESLGFGPVSPFVVALPVLCVCAGVVWSTWAENYGEPGQGSWFGSCGEGFYKIVNDPDVWLLGAVQSLFESVMYIFVFMWTPVLTAGAPPLGLVFAVYMVTKYFIKYRQSP